METGSAPTFADLGDLRDYIHARDDLGMSKEDALSVGDNGIGAWGDLTAQEHTPMVALSPEDWEFFGSAARGKKVRVIMGEKEIIAELRDTRPHKKNVVPGTVIEFNPATCKALGLTPPNTFENVSWEWS